MSPLSSSEWKSGVAKATQSAATSMSSPSKCGENAGVRLSCMGQLSRAEPPLLEKAPPREGQPLPAPLVSSDVDSYRASKMLSGTSKSFSFSFR